LKKNFNLTKGDSDDITLLHANTFLRILAFFIDISIIRFSFQGFAIILGNLGLFSESFVESISRNLLEGIAPFRGWYPFFNIIESFTDLKFHILISVYLLAYFIFLEHYWGKTIGKKITRMKVVSKRGENISLKNSFLRNITRYIWRLPIIGILLGFAEILMLFLYDGRVGDMLGNTNVVSKVQKNIFGDEK